ncbi:TetR/AcrR family transcriptional regulator [Nocardia alba]|uniref:TetR family transcriptional regulator n=1 Tax=Nocardia alba TaxID=225051 RepID=A0A4V2PB74_9NOCA|nr:TetR/AcrR family transcriptional regulator [Nocardia alba]TCJ96345.1 TetR family transcriptional regulator [Nocardia alba]
MITETSGSRGPEGDAVPAFVTGGRDRRPHESEHGCATTAADVRRYGGQTIATRKARRRRQFLDAATRVCAERGCFGCSLSDICASASLSKRQFYEEFHTLDEVLVAAYARIQDRAAVAVARALADQTGPVELVVALRAALIAYFAAIESEPHGARFALLEVSGVGELAQQQCRAHAHRWAGHIRSFLAARGSRPADDTVGLLTATVNAVAREGLSCVPELPPSSLIELLTSMAMLVVTRGASADHEAVDS